jgi:tetratricopeptide (TPR) repeat protein
MRKTFFIAVFLMCSSCFLNAQTDYLSKGNEYLQRGNYLQAEQTFRGAIQSDTSNLIYPCQLGLALMEQKKHKEAQEVLDHVILKDSNNIAALWYSGMNNFQDEKADLRKAIYYFEKVLPLLNEKQGQYYSANVLIGQSYRILLQSEGLSYQEVSKMLECYSIYLRLQPNADDAREISAFVNHINQIRPSDNVKKWINK